MLATSGTLVFAPSLSFVPGALYPDASALSESLSVVVNNVSTYNMVKRIEELIKTGPMSVPPPAEVLFQGLSGRIRELVPTSFFDYLISDRPAVPTMYDGRYSYSTQPGAYHAIMGILRNPQNPDEPLLYFCLKRASSTFVRIEPPYPPVEVAQVTSKYAKFWLSRQEGLESAPVPDQYCRVGSILQGSEGSGPGSVEEFSYQVYKDWVVFEGKTSSEGNVEITIKKVENGQASQVVKREVVATVNKQFSYTTHLPPGEYTYEVCAYSSGSGSGYEVN